MSVNKLKAMYILVLLCNFIFLSEEMICGTARKNILPIIILKGIYYPKDVDFHFNDNDDLKNIDIEIKIKFKYIGPTIETTEIYDGTIKNYELKGTIKYINKKSGTILEKEIDIVAGEVSGGGCTIGASDGKSIQEKIPSVIIVNGSIDYFECEIAVFADLNSDELLTITNTIKRKELASIILKLEYFNYRWEIENGKATLQGFEKGEMNLKINKSLKIKVKYKEIGGSRSKME